VETVAALVQIIIFAGWRLALVPTPHLLCPLTVCTISSLSLSLLSDLVELILGLVHTHM
jgi:hypothetical protein